MVSLLGHYYSFSPDIIGALTLRQVHNYLFMIRYVSPYSKDVGKTPPIPTLLTKELLEEAKKIGIKPPTNV